MVDTRIPTVFTTVQKQGLSWEAPETVDTRTPTVWTLPSKQRLTW